MIIACPSCATSNRIPAERLNAGGTCGRCGSTLFQGLPVILTATNFDAHAAKSDIALVVDFWASWCQPCRQMAPAFAAAAPHLEPDVRVGKVDTEAEPGLATRFAIRSIPTLVVFWQGREVARRSGAMPVGAIVQWARSVQIR